MNMRARGVFTIEASWVFGISFIVIYMMIVLSFELYGESASFIENTMSADKDYVELFRTVSAAKELLNGD